MDTTDKMARFMAWNVKKILAAKYGAKDTVLKELGDGWFELKLWEAEEREGEAKRGQDARTGWHGTTWTGLRGIVVDGKVYPGKRQEAKAQTRPWIHKIVAFAAKEKRIAIPYAEGERIGFGDINAEVSCMVRCVTGFGKTTNNTNYLQAESWAPVAIHLAISNVKGDGNKGGTRWYETQEGYGKGSDMKIATTEEKAKIEEEEKELDMKEDEEERKIDRVLSGECDECGEVYCTPVDERLSTKARRSIAIEFMDKNNLLGITGSRFWCEACCRGILGK